MKAPFNTLLGYISETEACREILNGTFTTPEGSSPAMYKFFKQLQRPEYVKDLPILPSFAADEDFRVGWKMMKEKTASGIS